MKRQVLWVPLVIWLATGCGHSEDRYSQRAVEPAELVGRYEATDFAMDGLKYAGFSKHLDPREHFLILSADGNCDVQTVIDPMTAGLDGEGKWIASGTPCKWESKPELPHQTVNVWVGDEGPSYYLDEEDGTLVLWQYAGDPDAWKYMELHKVRGSAG